MYQSIYQSLYQGWTVLISQEDSSWSYVCCPPAGEPLTNGKVYSSLASATCEAHWLIDQSLAAGRLRDLLDDWLELELISSREYRQADRLISELVRSGRADRAPVCQRPCEQPQETRSDSGSEYPA